MSERTDIASGNRCSHGITPVIPRFKFPSTSTCYKKNPSSVHRPHIRPKPIPNPRHPIKTTPTYPQALKTAQNRVQNAQNPSPRGWDSLAGRRAEVGGREAAEVARIPPRRPSSSSWRREPLGDRCIETRFVPPSCSRWPCRECPDQAEDTCYEAACRWNRPRVPNRL